MATFFTDWDEYSTGVAGTVLSPDFTVTEGTDWDVTIVDLGGGDHALRSDRTGAGGNAVSLVAYNAISTTGAVEAYARVILSNQGDQNAQIGPALIASDGRCYAWRPNTAQPATTWRLALFSNTGTVSASIGTAYTFSEPTAGTVFHLVVGRDASSNIYGYAWLDGGSKSGSPDISGNNTTLTTLSPGITTFDSSDEVMTFPAFGAADSGDAAPITEPAAGGGSSLLAGKFGGLFRGKLG